MSTLEKIKIPTQKTSDCKYNCKQFYTHTQNYTITRVQ